ncbi:MAG: response regulator transcription factor, partial [Lachnospiraceae bacterium]|nr:response regulator transcription factor [Lachnospiraceae bacterium]
GFACGQAYSGSECILMLRVEHYDLVLLDLALPGKTGEEVLREIRESGNHMPVIVVSAKDDLDSKVDVLSIGADDYVTKPFEIKEVTARIRVQLRKLADAKPETTDQISYGGIVLDRERFVVTADGKEVPKLTRQEYRILELLVQNPSRVFSKDAIYEYAWQEPYIGETKTLDVHMSNLRKKLKAASDREYIETIWGIGYRML